jgi:PAS domain-containing protein
MITFSATLLLFVASVAAGDGSEVVRCRAMQQTPADAVTACERAANALDVSADAEVYEEMLFRRADAEVATGDFAGASKTLQRVAAMPADGRWMHDYRLARRRGILAYRQSDIATALTHFRAALSLAIERGDTTTEGQSRNDIGNALRRSGRYREALEAYTSSLALKRRGNETQLGALLNNIGDLHRDLDDPAAAQASYLEALALQEQEGRPLDTAHTLESLGTLSLDTGNLAAAADYLTRARQTFVLANARSDQMRVATRLARLSLDRNDTPAARASIDEAMALSRDIGVRPPADLVAQAAREALARDAAAEAETLLAEALGRIEANAPERVPLLQLHADAALARGDAREAYRRLQAFHRADAAQRNREHDQRLTALRVQFEVAEKDRALERLAAQNEITSLQLRQRTTQLAALVAAALAALALTALAIRRTRERARIAAAEREGRHAVELEHYRSAAAALDLDVRRVQALLDRTPSALVALDTHGEIIAANAAAGDAFGRDSAALIGTAFRSYLDPRAEREFESTFAELDETDIALDLDVALVGGDTPRRYRARIATLDAPGGAAVVSLSADDNADLGVAIGAGQHRLQAASASLAASLAANESGAEAALQAIETAAAALDAASPASNRDEEERFRRDLVELMLSAVTAWEQSTGKSRIDLAEKCRAWRVTIDDGRLRVRALERYLSLAKLPRQPRWREVLRTAFHVLAECPLAPEQRAELKQRVDAVQSDLRRRALLY